MTPSNTVTAYLVGGPRHGETIEVSACSHRLPLVEAIELWTGLEATDEPPVKSRQFQYRQVEYVRSSKLHGGEWNDHPSWIYIYNG